MRRVPTVLVMTWLLHVGSAGAQSPTPGVPGAPGGSPGSGAGTPGGPTTGAGAVPGSPGPPPEGPSSVPGSPGQPVPGPGGAAPNGNETSGSGAGAAGAAPQIGGASGGAPSGGTGGMVPTGRPGASGRPGSSIAGGDPPDVPMMTPKPIVTLAPPPQPRTPLTLDEVLSNVETRYPLLLAERQALTAAEGEEYSAWGSFDPKWKTKGSIFPVGYYQYGMIDSVIEQPLYWRGISVFGGYRIGQGKFPIYYDGYRTNSLGEARVGVVVPILRGGSIDEDRAKLWKAEAGVDAAREGLAATKLDFQRGASYKYWEWIAASKKLEIAKRLLQRALDRNLAITTRVARGDAAAVDQTDNARAIVQREQQVVTAERALTAARLSLSLYLRDEDGNPVIPSPERVPERFPEPARLDARTVEDDVSRALGKRPEVKMYEARRRQYEVERRLAENDAWPTLNVLVAGAKQFGDGYPERQPAALEAGLVLDIPLRTRKADGRAQAADARFVQYEIQLRYTRDKIALEVRDAAAGTDAAAARLGLARRELELAQQLEQAERQRFDMGDSNILFVNIREQATFDAANRELDTLLEHHKALALYRAVVGGP